MATDINSAGLEWQSDVDGKWHRVAMFYNIECPDGSIDLEEVSPFPYRNSDFFSAIAGVRGLPSNGKVISDCRGMPEDATARTKNAYQKFPGNKFGIGYVTLDEIYTAAKDKSYTKSERRFFKMLARNIEFMLDTCWIWPDDDTCVRWVFFFDN